MGWLHGYQELVFRALDVPSGVSAPLSFALSCPVACACAANMLGKDLKLREHIQTAQNNLVSVCRVLAELFNPPDANAKSWRTVSRRELKKASESLKNKARELGMLNSLSQQKPRSRSSRQVSRC